MVVDFQVFKGKLEERERQKEAPIRFLEFLHETADEFSGEYQEVLYNLAELWKQNTDEFMLTLAMIWKQMQSAIVESDEDEKFVNAINRIVTRYEEEYLCQKNGQVEK